MSGMPLRIASAKGVCACAALDANTPATISDKKNISRRRDVAQNELMKSKAAIPDFCFRIQRPCCSPALGESLARHPL
jgi:hypothetical protein